LALLTASLLITGTIAELVVRRLDHDAFPRLRMFERAGDGSIVLASNTAARLIGSRGTICEIVTGPHGVRVQDAGAAEPRGAWLAVGDSQVLGFGVADRDTFVARASAAGVPMINAGVPGYGVEDALHRAATLVGPLRARGVLLVVNQANDWEEVGQPIERRFRVRGGWLLQAANADGWRARYLASPISRLHLFYYAMQPIIGRGPSNFTAAATIPGWLSAPQTQDAATHAMAAAVRRFASTQPHVPVVVAFLPVDCATSAIRALRSPFASLLRNNNPWMDHTLRDQLRMSLVGTTMIDLLPALTDADDFLDDDYHLSPRGHLAVAQVLVSQLSERTAR